MNWGYIISGLALLISIIFSLITIFSNRKKDKFEIKKGEILTLGLLGRYFTMQYNCWDQNGHMKLSATHSCQLPILRTDLMFTK